MKNHPSRFSPVPALALFALQLSIAPDHAHASAAGTPDAPPVASLHQIDIAGAGLKPSQPLAGMGAIDPKRGVLSVNNYFFTLGGVPLPIVSGELHPQRVPEDEWEEAVLRMKAGGLNTVSLYVFWTLVEPRPGKFDFTGRNNIRRLVELCQRHGMYATVRIGPFCNGEMLCGGLPPWLYGMPFDERSNDPGYLEVVGRFYRQVGDQLKGLFFQDGGPIITVQLENELSVAPISWDRVYGWGAHDEHRGPEGADFTQHYRNLHRLALKGGIAAPFFTATSWGDTPNGEKTSALFPYDELLPLFGGYMYLQPPRIGRNESLTTFQPHTGAEFRDKVPLLFCEVGTGTVVRAGYVEEPPARSGPVTSMAFLGPTTTLSLGYYMYRGGSNPMHPDYGFVAKSENWPLISYDYHAPLGEFGEPRAQYFELRTLNNFVRNFGAELACAAPCLDPNPPTTPNDDRLRVVARANRDRGFLFAMNYGNMVPLSPKAAVISIKTAAGELRIPRTGSLAVDPGDVLVLPFNLSLGHGIDLISATAQPFSRASDPLGEVLFFHTKAGRTAEYVLDAAGPVSVIAPSGAVTRENNLVECAIAPGHNSVVEIRAKDGALVRLMTLTTADAESASEAIIHGTKYLLLSRQLAVATNDRIRLTALGSTEFELLTFPHLPRATTPDGEVVPVADGVLTVYRTTTKPVTIQPAVQEVSEAKRLVQLKASNFDSVNNVFVNINATGGICRIFDVQQGLMVADHFRDSQPWLVGLNRFRRLLDGEGLLVRASPADEKLAVSPSDGEAGRMLVTLSKPADRTEAKILDLEFVPEYFAELAIDGDTVKQDKTPQP